MLRIKRLKKHTLITLREKDKWMHLPLLQGLVYAFVFHLLLLSLFQVHFEKKQKNLSLQHPIIVQVDLHTTSLYTKRSDLLFFQDIKIPCLSTKPVVHLPLSSDGQDYILVSPKLSSGEESIEYEALDIDFDDDQD